MDGGWKEDMEGETGSDARTGDGRGVPVLGKSSIVFSALLR
jgi:hypothetical protein